MDTEELEDFILNKWVNTYNKNTGSMFLTGDKALSEILLCNECYKQLTGKSIFTNLSVDIWKDAAIKHPYSDMWSTAQMGQLIAMIVGYISNVENKIDSIQNEKI